MYDENHKKIALRHLDLTFRKSRFYPYIYLNNPKSACSTIKLNLERHEAHRYPDTPLRFERNPDLGKLDDNFIFSFVRNPFARALSVYNNKITRMTDQKRLFCKLTGIASTDEVSFRQFLEGLQGIDTCRDDRHWRLQADNILVGFVPIHYIGYLESFDKDLEHVLKTIFGEDTVNTENWTRNRTGASKKLQDMYDQSCIDLVLAKYAQDFDIFGYSTDINIIMPVNGPRSIPVDPDKGAMLCKKNTSIARWFIDVKGHTRRRIAKIIRA